MFLLLVSCLSRAPQAPLPPPVEPTLVRVDEGPLSGRVTGGDGAGLVLFYTGEEGGSLEPCGCEDRPRGGLARVAAYVEAAVAADPTVPMLLVNGGGWLADPRTWKGEDHPGVLVGNRWMAEGLRAVGAGALNVGSGDLAGLSRLGGDAAGLPLVSANVSAEGLDIQPWRVIETGGLRVGVTGITSPPAEPVPGVSVRDPGPAARAALLALDPLADVVVLLAYHTPEVAARLARELPVDVVVDTYRHTALYAPFREGRALWVRSQHQTTRLGELRLGLEAGATLWALERKIDLGPDLPDDREIGALVERAKDEIDRASRGRP